MHTFLFLFVTSSMASLKLCPTSPTQNNEKAGYTENTKMHTFYEQNMEPRLMCNGPTTLITGVALMHSKRRYRAQEEQVLCSLEHSTINMLILLVSVVEKTAYDAI